MQQETRVRNASRNVVFGMFLKGYQILLPFIMRTAIMYYFGNGYGGIKRLVVKRHLKLQTCVGVVLQGISYVIRISIGRTVGDRYGWIYIVIIVGKPIDFR